MNQQLSSSPPTPAPWLSRVARLAQKELRETLRDRRTIITLVLMPLLVYPVLSIALKQFLVSTTTTQASQIRLNIATETEPERATLNVLLERGEALLREQEPTAASTPLAGGPILGADLGAGELPVKDNNIVSLGGAGKLEDFVRNNAIDLGVRLLPPDQSEDTRAESPFQLFFNPGVPLSRQAARFVERRLQAVNDSDLRQRLISAKQSTRPRTSWRMVAVADEQGHSFWLGALVPLVLILMTVTGAVYPAIDLTAGERERGTLESLMAAPVPRLSVLIAKYIAVVTVATMTAVINLTAMTATLALLGPQLWTLFFGNQGSPAEALFAVLLLLVLFSMFFTAVLLLVTSFARSFKEAQAYVVPLMVVCLAPGFMSVMPGLRLNWLLSIVPLANIVLLARDVLEGSASLIWGAVAVISTVIYGGLALALAARVFGSDAILYGSEGSWSDLFRRPATLKQQPTITGVLTAIAIVVPVFVIVTGLLGYLPMTSISSKLLAEAAATLLLFLALPLGLARLQGVEIASAFQLRRPSALTMICAALMGLTLWPLAYDVILWCQHRGIATFDLAKFAERQPALVELIKQLPSASPLVLYFAIAIAAPIAEEFFFRGYMLSALRGRVPAWAAILITAGMFGLFHSSAGGIIAVERVASSTLLGIVLGCVCWRTGSVFPGMLLHALHNGMMVSLIFLAPQLEEWKIDQQHYLPPGLVAVTTVVAVLAAAVLMIDWRRLTSSRLPNGTADASQAAAPSDVA
jgi:ABC-2 type transport system permease protein/sodium transport system permease protein